MKTYIIANDEVIKEFMHHGAAGVIKLRKPFMLHEGHWSDAQDAAKLYGGEFRPLNQKETIILKNAYGDTPYQGTYIDVRDGIRYHVTFTYQIKDGDFVNEKEISARELGPVLQFN